MRVAMKFGRKVPMPSAVQIKHDLRMMTATDELAAALQTNDCTPDEIEGIIAGISEKYGIPSDVAQQLTSRIQLKQCVAM